MTIQGQDLSRSFANVRILKCAAAHTQIPAGRIEAGQQAGQQTVVLSLFRASAGSHHRRTRFHTHAACQRSAEALHEPSAAAAHRNCSPAAFDDAPEALHESSAAALDNQAARPRAPSGPAQVLPPGSAAACDCAGLRHAASSAAAGAGAACPVGKCHTLASPAD